MTAQCQKSQRHSSASSAKRPMILLDRDGVLIEEKEYLGNPHWVKLLPGVVSGLTMLHRAGYPLVVISNQSGVARGLISYKAVERVNQRLLELLRQKKIVLDGLYWCPHGPDDQCLCRKPNLGMVKQAARELGCSWKGAISIGDRPSDVVLGQRAGGHGILVLTGYGSRYADESWAKPPDYVAKNFQSAVQWILNHGV